jgi:hypothetical protein
MNDYSKLMEICGGETDHVDTDDIYEIVVQTAKIKIKFNTNKNFQLLDVSTDLKKFTTNDKKIIK